MIQILRRRKACESIVAFGMNEQSAEVAEAFLLGVLCGADDLEIRRVAAIGLSHAVRSRHSMELPETREILQEVRGDPIVGGEAEDSLNEIDMFTRKQGSE